MDKTREPALIAGRSGPAVSLRVAIIVQGRYEVFELARSLPERGHRVTLITLYPVWMVRNFGVLDAQVRSFWVFGGIQWLLGKTSEWARRISEPLLNRVFGCWAASRVARGKWDLVLTMSGVSEETLRVLRGKGIPVLLIRASAHIRTQARILKEERRRTGARVELPSDWIIRREEREYQLAEHIRVLSGFSRRSFIEEGVPEAKIRLIPSGMPVDRFRSSRETFEERLRRIRSGNALNVLYVGAISFQKGFWDIAAVARVLPAQRFRFRLVGSVSPEAANLVELLRGQVEILPRRPESGLPAVYAAADLFLFPTLQDGYAQTLAQAYAAGLPVVTTDRCQGPDFLSEGETGWIVPAGSPEAIISRLQWADKNREELAALARRVYEAPRARTWTDVAEELEDFIRGIRRPISGKNR